MASIQNLLTVLVRRKDRGATTAGYGLTVAPIAAIIVTFVTSIATNLNAVFSNTATTI